jgi:uncharacterized membrane protein YccF (DUF307 family)
MSYQDPYQQGYGQQQQPGYDPAAYPPPPGYEPPGYNQPYSASPVTPAPYQQAPYGQTPYGQPVYAAPASAATNTMAILSLVFAFVFAPVGIILGHIAKKQLRETGEQGEGLATAGLIISYIHVGIWLVVCGIWLVLIIALGAGSSSGTSDYDYLIRLALGA